MTRNMATLMLTIRVSNPRESNHPGTFRTDLKALERGGFIESGMLQTMVRDSKVSERYTPHWVPGWSVTDVGRERCDRMMDAAMGRYS